MHIDKSSPVRLFAYLDAPPSARVEVVTRQGPFSFVLGEIGSRTRHRFMGGHVAVERLAPSTRITTGATEEDFPALAIGRDGVAWMTYVAYTRGSRVPLDQAVMPDDLAAKVGRGDWDDFDPKGNGDQLLLMRFDGSRWSAPMPATPAGLDYRIIDGEHTAWDDEAVAAACGIGRLLDFPVLIRPPETRERLVRMAADKGPCGLLLPYVESAAVLDEVRDALHMPPRGRRRPGGPVLRWVDSYQAASMRETLEDPLVVLPQIESRRGLENAGEIARHELTTAMAVGPYDLSANLGVCWQPDSPVLAAAIEQVRAAGRAAGKEMWMVGDAAELMERGFTFLCIADPIDLCEQALRSEAAALRARAAGAQANQAPS